MLSSELSSSQGTLFDPLLTRRPEKNRDEHVDNRPEPESALGVTTAGERQHHGRLRQQNMCPAAENKQPTSERFDFHPSTHGDGPDPPALTKQKHFVSFFSLSLFLPSSSARHPLLPGVIKYANDLCWACRSYCSHSNTTARKHPGGVHYRAGSLKLSPAAAHTGPRRVTWSWKVTAAMLCHFFSWPASAFTFVSRGVNFKI